jgi:hypothetical protein
MARIEFLRRGQQHGAPVDVFEPKATMILAEREHPTRCAT